MSSLASKATNELVTPLFFVRLVFGFTAEIKAVQNAVQSNIIRRSTLPLDAQQTTNSTVPGSPLAGDSNFYEVNPINSISHMVGSTQKGNEVVDLEATISGATTGTKESDIGDLRSMKAAKIKV